MDYLLAFIIGSSIIIFLITFLYVGYAYRKSNRPDDLPYEIAPVIIPIMYGLFNIINVGLQSKGYSPNIAFIVGAIMGEIFSLVGRFKYNLPILIFGFDKSNAYLVHLIAPILYGLIFRFPLQKINQLFLLD